MFPIVAQNLGIPDLGFLVVKLLAVGGAAALGWFASAGLLQVVSRALTRRAPPRFPLLVVRTFGGIGFAVLVWMWVFSPGGLGGLGGGSGWRPFGGSGNAKSSLATDAKQKTAVTDRPVPKAIAANKTTLSIRLLGGAQVQDQRFYLPENHEMAQTISEIQETLRKKAGDSLNSLEITLVIAKDSVDRDNPAVTELKEWAESQGYRVSLSFP